MNEKNPLVSVVCVTYNHEKYIKDALKSFICQKTEYPFEIIVHDDASTDQTAQIISDYAARYPDLIVKILQKENKYSKGIYPKELVSPFIRGKYVAICEGDDYWCDENKLQKQVSFLEGHKDYSACVHLTKTLDEKSGNMEMFGSKFENYENLSDGEDISFEQIVRGGSSGFHTSSIVMPKEYYINRPEFGKICPTTGDFPLKLNLALKGKIYRINEYMSVYRLNTSNSWSKRMEESNEMALKVNRQNIEMLREVDRQSGCRYHNSIEETIRGREYRCFELVNDFRSMKLPKYKDYYCKQSFKRKLKISVLSLLNKK